MSEHNDESNELAFLGENYRTLAKSLPICLVLKDLQGRVVVANDAFLEFLDRPMTDVVGKSMFDLHPKKTADILWSDDLRAQESGESAHGTIEHESPDGTTQWVERINTPILDPQGKLVGVQSLFWDVTRRKRAEEALRQERFLLNTLLDNVPDSIYFKDINSRFIRVTRSLAEKFGEQDVNGVVGKTDADVFTSEHAKQALADERRIIETGEPLVGRIERETWPEDGATWCSTTKMALHDEQGEIVGTFGISRDITELKNTEEELRRARDVADAASRTSAQFVANMSHEIRTPMNGIIGMAELLSDTELAPEQRDYLGMIQQSADSLLTLLNDILDFSKVEAGKLRLEQIEFDLSDCVGRTVQTMATRAADKGLELACRVAPDLPERLLGDPGRLRQVIVNLVGNAIKFTTNGEVVVDVATDTRDNGDVILHFSVRDTGVGIPEKQQDAIFGAFSQADASTTRRFGGTGLGLTISKQLVELMGGSIWIESQVGRGSVFHFTAMFKVAKRQPPNSRHMNALTGLRTLVVDDNETNRRILEEILKSWQLSPSMATGGVEAFAELTRAAREGRPYELVLLDCMMPGMDGFALAELISGNTTIPTPMMIMISSAARGSDVHRCEGLGIFRHMSKPVVKSELFNTIIEAAGVDRGVHDDPHTENMSEESLRVLLVEDGLINQRVATGLLERAGHQVSIANNGREAVNAVRNQDFDVVLMDLQMPVLDGFEATKEIRDLEEKTGAHVRIVAMTAAAMAGDREQCLASGMDDYVSKPFARAQLIRVLSPHDRRMETETTGADTTVPSQYFDFSLAESKIPGGESVLRELATLFLSECPRLVHDIDTGLKNDDMTLAKRAAHTLTSSCKTVLAGNLANDAAEIETHLRAENDERASQKLIAMNATVERTLAAISNWLAE